VHDPGRIFSPLLLPIATRADELAQRHDQDAVDLVRACSYRRRVLCHGHEGKDRDQAARGVHYRELTQHLDGTSRERHLLEGLAQGGRERRLPLLDAAAGKGDLTGVSPQMGRPADEHYRA